MDELQTLIKPVLVHNTCCHAKLAARRDKGKWIKESGSALLPSPRHDSGSGGKCFGSSAGRLGEEPPRYTGMSHTRRGGGGDGKAVQAATIDHQHTAAARRDEPSHETRGRCRGVFTMMNIRGMNVMVMSEGTVSRGSAVMCGRLHD